MTNNEIQRPNIVWISTHDINPHLGCYAGVWPHAEYAHTPNLDRLAAEGIRFDNALSTTPVCGPSRSAIITGMYPTAIGTMHMRTRGLPPPEVRPIPETMRRAGYYCTSSPFADYQFQTPVTTFDDFGPQAHWRNRPNPDQPFFAMFHGLITHESRIYVDDDQFAESTSRLTTEERHDPADAPLPPYFPDTPEFRQAIARYNDLITAMDYWVEDILHELEADGLADNTLVIFWSEHGAGFPRHKRWPYEGGLRVPLIVRWPSKIAPGSVCREPTCMMDLAATTLAAARLPVPDTMHAKPLFDAQGALTSPREYVFGHRDRMDSVEDTVRSVRDGRFHYLRNYHPDRPYMQHQSYSEPMSTWKTLRQLRSNEMQQILYGELPSLLTPEQRQFLASSKPEEELYDILADPFEINNLAADPAYADDLARLRQALERWHQTYPDLGMIDEVELFQRWWPDGRIPKTDEPMVSIEAGQVVANCATEGAVIGWTTDPPPPPDVGETGFMARLGQIVGNPNSGGRHWQIYEESFTLPNDQTLWFRAQRLGYAESDDVVLS